MVFCDIASFYSPKGGGVATYHERKLDYFARHPEHRYVMIVPAEKDGVEDVPGGTVYRVRGFRFDANYRHLYSAPALRRILKAVRPDVLEFGSPYLDYWAGALAARGLAIVQTAYYHVDFPDTYVRPFLRRHFGAAEDRLLGPFYRYVKLVFRRLDATLAASRFIYDKLRAIGLDNVTYLPLGVDTETFDPARRDASFRRGLGIGETDKLLFFAGRYRADKGVDLLLEALPRILDDPAMHVGFAGAGPLERRVRRWASDHGRVHDLGFIGDKALLARAYASADGFLSPGHRETFGLGICEALASGTPVVSADAGAGAEMVSRFGCGLLFKAGDADGLARGARAIVRSDLRAGIAAARDALKTRHGWDLILGTYVDHHASLIGKKRTGPPLRP
jgi:alpha-1,6-mannosyltransferase